MIHHHTRHWSLSARGCTDSYPFGTRSGAARLHNSYVGCRKTRAILSAALVFSFRGPGIQIISKQKDTWQRARSTSDDWGRKVNRIFSPRPASSSDTYRVGSHRAVIMFLSVYPSVTSFVSFGRRISRDRSAWCRRTSSEISHGSVGHGSGNVDFSRSVQLIQWRNPRA